VRIVGDVVVGDERFIKVVGLRGGGFVELFDVVWIVVVVVVSVLFEYLPVIICII
jgi:hypothetical protein